MMTTVQALVWSGILTFVMMLVAAALCARAWTPEGMADRLRQPRERARRHRHGRTRRSRGEETWWKHGAAHRCRACRAPRRQGAQAASGATVFFWARLVYWPAYLAGIVYLRTAIWTVSVIGLVLIVKEIW